MDMYFKHSFHKQLSPGHNGQHFEENISKYIFWKDCCISIKKIHWIEKRLLYFNKNKKISLNFIPKGPIDNK